MSFYKDAGGIFLFLICQINFILQFYFIYTITFSESTILNIHKSINYIFLFLTVYSNLKTAFINPGEITLKNNKEIIEFYYQIHEPLIKRALFIIEKKTPEVVKRIIQGNSNTDNLNNEDEPKDENDSINSDKDDYDFEPVTSINDNMKKIIEEKYKMKVSRCINCYVVRPLNSHHCNVCHKCFLDQDHHCPWVNNCIGLFNKKFFLLFLIYGFIEIIYSFILFFYYSLYKNYQLTKNINLEASTLIIDIFSILFGLIQAIVSAMLLWDQYDGMENDCVQCDFKRGILLEKSTMKQQLQIIFGGIFNIRWLLPFFPGGNIIFFKELCDFLKMREMQKRIINDNNINKEGVGFNAKKNKNE